MFAPDYSNMINRAGNSYTIERNGQVINTLKGVVHTEEKTNKKYIGFLPNADIKINDHLVNAANDHLVVTDTYTKFMNDKPWQLKAYYISLAEFEKQQNTSSQTVFNIGSATNSVIGNYNTLNVSVEQALSDIKNKTTQYPQDKEELEQLVTLLEMITNGKVPAKKGILSNFADTIAKHSWLTGPMAQAVINWLMSQM